MEQKTQQEKRPLSGKSGKSGNTNQTSSSGNNVFHKAAKKSGGILKKQA